MSDIPDIGERVLWLWNDGKWYAGQVVEITDSYVSVLYDDDGVKHKHKLSDCHHKKTWLYDEEQKQSKEVRNSKEVGNSIEVGDIVKIVRGVHNGSQDYCY